MSIEAMKQALEALERIDLWLKARYSGIGLVGVELEAITSLRQAIAEAELPTQEELTTLYTHQPVSTNDISKERVAETPKNVHEQEPVAWMRTSGIGSPVVTNEMLNAHPEMHCNFQQPLYTHPPQRSEDAKQPKVEQEPYGWAYQSHGRFTCNAHPIFWKTRKAETHTEDFWEEIPLYRHPQPKREWVGLTMEEVQEILNDPRYQMKPMIVHAVETKLKEKNV